MKSIKIIGATTIASVMLASCSTVEKLNPFGGNEEKEIADAAEKAGRISMVSADDQLQADPDLISTAVILPDAVSVTAWPEAGRVPTKVLGHVEAGANFDEAWKWSKAEGSSNTRSLTVAPIAVNGEVFVFDADQTVHAVNADTGKSSWSYEVKSGNKKDQRAFGGGLAATEGLLIVASGFGKVIALDINTGSELWVQDMMTPMTGSPTIIGQRIFLASNNNEFFALRLSDGEIEWTDQAIAESARVLSSPSPAGIEDFIVAPYSSGEVIAYLPSNGRRLWTDSLTRAGRFTPISAINDIASRPVLTNGLVFASSQSGVLAAIDGRTGTRVWSLPFGSTQAPVIVGEFLFAVGVDADLICVEAATGRVVWVQRLQQYAKEEKKKGRISYSGPLVASNRLVVLSSDGRIIAFSPQTGDVIEEKSLVKTGRFGADAGFFLEPIAYDGKILALADNGTLFAIR